MDRVCVMCNYAVYQSVEIKGDSWRWELDWGVILLGKKKIVENANGRAW